MHRNAFLSPTWRSAPRLFGTASAAAAIAALAACGSTSTNSGGSGGSSNSTPETVTAMNYSFTPSDLSVPAGASIALTFKNDGSVEHSFTLDNGAGEVEADGGTTKSFSFTAPQSGTLTWHCKYHPTQMRGTITVGGSGGAGAGGSGGSGSGTPTPTGAGGYGY